MESKSKLLSFVKQIFPIRLSTLVVFLILISSILILLFAKGDTSFANIGNEGYRDIVKLSCLGYYLKPCDCFKHTSIEFFNNGTLLNKQSTCSYEADLHGTGQRIISFAIFDPNAKKEANVKDNLEEFTEGIYPNLSQIKRYYPGWLVRIYTNFNLTEEYCKVACLDNVFWCDIRNSTVPNMEITNNRVWRFLPLGDPTVDIFVSRDIDSYIIEREREMVEDWITNYPAKGFHCARDSGTHNTREMLAGIWGARNDVLGFKFAREIRDTILKRSKNNYKRETDELLLKEIIFKKHQDKLLQHDSYLCKHYKGAVPFPMQRKHRHARIAQSIRNIARYLTPACPEACRPSYGKNWTYC